MDIAVPRVAHWDNLDAVLRLDAREFVDEVGDPAPGDADVRLVELVEGVVGVVDGFSALPHLALLLRRVRDEGVDGAVLDADLTSRLKLGAQLGFAVGLHAHDEVGGVSVVGELALEVPLDGLHGVFAHEFEGEWLHLTAYDLADGLGGVVCRLEGGIDEGGVLGLGH